MVPGVQGRQDKDKDKQLQSGRVERRYKVNALEHRRQPNGYANPDLR